MAARKYIDPIIECLQEALEVSLLLSKENLANSKSTESEPMMSECRTTERNELKKYTMFLLSWVARIRSISLTLLLFYFTTIEVIIVELQVIA
jgi:hypothetical protein